MDLLKLSVNKLTQNGKVVTQQDKSEDNVVEEYLCSSAIDSHQAVVKGEYNNANPSKRNAMILLFKQGTDQIIGNQCIIY